MAKRRRRNSSKTTLGSVLLLLLLLAGYLIYLFVTGGLSPEEPYIPVEGELSVHCIDVGQGDSILITDGAHHMLVDTGDLDNENTERILSYLSERSITTLDYLVLTHPDADHIGGAPEIIEALTVKNCIMPDYTKTTKIFEQTVAALEAREVNVLEAVAGDDYTLGQARFRILAPLHKNYDDTNDHSVVFRMSYGTRSFLMTGDAEKASEADMVQRYTASDLKADVLKVGHHGSGTSSSHAFLNLVQPTYAVISCGTGNSYDHPHEPVLDRLTDRNVAYYRTDLHGTVVIVTDGEFLRITTEKAS